MIKPDVSKHIKLYTQDPKKGPVLCGEYWAEFGLYCRAIKPEHLMRVMGNSVGMQTDIAVALEDMGCLYVALQQNTTVLLSAFRRWLGDDIKTRDFGHGAQLFYPVDRMIPVPLRGFQHGDCALYLEKATVLTMPEPPEPVQMGLL